MRPVHESSGGTRDSFSGSTSSRLTLDRARRRGPKRDTAIRPCKLRPLAHESGALPLMTDLWIATGNAKKRVELERLLGGAGYRIRTIADLDTQIEIVEDGDTFAANAAIKALALHLATGKLAVGDDSGLCVDGLDGGPGVYSARYAGPGASDRDRIDKLLGQLGGLPEKARRARFVCHVCVAERGEVVAGFQGECHGRIARQPRGAHGFGYDPVFVPDEFADREPAPTFAELDPDEKDAISHRGIALRSLVAHLTTADHLRS